MTEKKREMQWTFPSFCAILSVGLASSGREAGHLCPQPRAGADIVRSLVGAVPRTDLTLSDLRDERLRKYEAAD